MPGSTGRGLDAERDSKVVRSSNFPKPNKEKEESKVTLPCLIAGKVLQGFISTLAYSW